MSTDYFIKIWDENDKRVAIIWANDHTVIEELEKISAKGPVKVSIFKAFLVAEELHIKNTCPIRATPPP